MIHSIRVTLIFGLLSGLSIFPLAHLAASPGGWALILKYFTLVNLMLYCLMLCHWSSTSVVSVAYPLLLATAVALCVESLPDFLPVALGVFGWIRSGICFRNLSMSIIMVEIITIIGGAGFLIFYGPRSAGILAAAVWFFFLVQTLYFYCVPEKISENAAAGLFDPFESACLETERILKIVSNERS